MDKIGFIGMGNMGYAMLKGALRYKQPSELTFTDVAVSRMEDVKKETGVDFYTDKKEMLKAVKYIILAVSFPGGRGDKRRDQTRSGSDFHSAGSYYKLFEGDACNRG